MSGRSASAAYGLFARLLNPHHLFIGGGRADLALLRDAIQGFVRDASTNEASEAELSTTVPLVRRKVGDFSELHVVLAAKIDPISPYREYGAPLPPQYKHLVEMDIECLAMPREIEMVRATCDIASNACEWAGWLLASATAHSETGSPTPLSASTEPVCPRCGKRARLLDSPARFIRALDEEEADKARLADIVCLPWHYMGEPEEPESEDEPDPEYEEAVAGSPELNFSEDYFLTAYRESDERVTIRGDKASLSVLAERCAYLDPDDDDHDHIRLVTADIPHFGWLLIDSKCALGSPERARKQPADGDAPPDLVVVGYGLCVTEPGACEWQGWFLDCTFHYPKHKRPEPNDRWQFVSEVCPEALCPRCGRKLIDIATALFRPRSAQ